jgi:Flp pilus assembly protein TadG
LRILPRDRRGAIAVFVAAGIIPLVAMAGLAIDTTRGYLVKARLNQALDAAALAGGRVYFDPERDADVRNFFDANFPQGFLGAELGELDIDEDTENGRLTVSATARIPTTFTRVLGFEELNVSARSVVERADRGMELVLVMDNTGSMLSSGKIGEMRDAANELVGILYGDRQTVPNFWVSLVPYTATVNIGRANAGWLAPGALLAADYEIGHGEVDEDHCDGDFLYSGWDPEWDSTSQACLVGTAIDESVHGATTQAACENGAGGPGDGPGIWDPASNRCHVTEAWKGCVEARYDPSGALGDDVTDAPPGAAPFQPYYWPRWRDGDDISQRYNSWLFDEDAYDELHWGSTSIDERASTNTSGNDGRGPNLGCGPAITPWTDQRATVEGAIAGMDAWHRGGTATNLGLVWGWRLLSPRWRGLWGHPDLPLPYDEPLMQKVAVILTDGDNGFYNGHAPSGDTDYTAYGRLSDGNIGTTNIDTARESLNARTLEVCTAMKAEDIIIYTITFDVPTNSRGEAIRDTFERCATTPGHFFDSYGGAGLSQTFRVIAAQLSNLRIAE